MGIQIELEKNGYLTLNDIYSNLEISQIISEIENIELEKDRDGKSTKLFAIRHFFKEVPGTFTCIFNDNLKTIIKKYFGSDFFVVKSIYFDKPLHSNWFVSYHQDLTISVNQKMSISDFKGWTRKKNQFSVQPSISVLENIFTIRIHLDDTDEKNGALKVIPKSHTKGIYRPETINWDIEQEVICNVKKGSVMMMKPLFYIVQAKP